MTWTPDSGGPIRLDGDDLYYGDSHLNRIKKDGSSSAPEELFEAKGGVSEITSDKDSVYFVYGASVANRSAPTRRST